MSAFAQEVSLALRVRTSAPQDASAGAAIVPTYAWRDKRAPEPGLAVGYGSLQAARVRGTRLSRRHAKDEANPAARAGEDEPWDLSAGRAQRRKNPQEVTHARHELRRRRGGSVGALDEGQAQPERTPSVFGSSMPAR
jgi:hypothetical protein